MLKTIKTRRTMTMGFSIYLRSLSGGKEQEPITTSADKVNAEVVSDETSLCVYEADRCAVMRQPRDHHADTLKAEKNVFTARNLSKPCSPELTALCFIGTKATSWSSNFS